MQQLFLCHCHKKCQDVSASTKWINFRFQKKIPYHHRALDSKLNLPERGNGTDPEDHSDDDAVQFVCCHEALSAKGISSLRKLTLKILLLVLLILLADESDILRVWLLFRRNLEWAGVVSNPWCFSTCQNINQVIMTYFITLISSLFRKAHSILSLRGKKNAGNGIYVVRTRCFVDAKQELQSIHLNFD